jgi:ferredoxin
MTAGTNGHEAEGRFPTDALPRRAALAPAELEALRAQAAMPSPLPEASPLQAAIARVAEVWRPLHQGMPATTRIAPAEGPVPAARQLRAAAHFLGADLVGFCAVPDWAWQPGTAPAHGHALVIAMADGIEPPSGAPGAALVAGAGPAKAAWHAAHITLCLAEYLRKLGWAAQAHTVLEARLAPAPLAVLAGLAWSGGASPFLGTRWQAAVVSTDLPLAPDRPLALRRLPTLRHARFRLALRGADAGLLARALPGRDGLPRRDTPTTLVLPDQVQRSPKRASFMSRTRRGDLGEKTRRDVERFAAKHPLAAAVGPVLRALGPLQQAAQPNGPAPAPRDPVALRDDLRAVALFLGADDVGTCVAPPHVWYSHDEDGTPIEPYHPNAIVLLNDQGFRTMDASSGNDWIAGANVLRGYCHGTAACEVMAELLRRLGHGARSQTGANSDVLHIPLMLMAGLGEMSRIGEVVVHPWLGPRCKSLIVTTDAPMAPDQPVDFGLQAACAACMRCAVACPCDAIPYGGKILFNGYETWKPDAERCTRFRITNLKGSACGRCLKSCPYNAGAGIGQTLFVRAIAAMPRLASLVLRIEGRLRRRGFRPARKWWPDLEVVAGTVRPGAAPDETPLDAKPQRSPPPIAIFPPELSPPPDAAGAVPPERARGVALARAAEGISAARRRLGL